MARKVIDCRDTPNDVGCTLTISGEEEEVVQAAALHAVAVHGHAESDDLRRSLRGMLKDEPAASPSPEPGTVRLRSNCPWLSGPLAGVGRFLMGCRV